MTQKMGMVKIIFKNCELKIEKNVIDIFQKFVNGVEYPTYIFELENGEQVEYSIDDIAYMCNIIECPDCYGDGRCEYITSLTWGGDVTTKIMECENCGGLGHIEISI